MPGIFQSLDIARRAIWASRLGMDVTSHNIANVNTEGYSRQRVSFRTATPLQLPNGQLGLGVAVGDVIRVRNRLVDQQYRQTSFTLGNAQIKESVYSQIEAIVQEPSDNALGSLMNEFFNEFSNLADDPENATIRDTVRQKAIALVDSFQGKTQQFNSLRQSLSKDVQATVGEVNEIIHQIGILNRQIVSAEAGGGSANDMRDRRDLLLDRLSEYMKISYTENARGAVSVSAEGVNLVSGNKVNELSVQTVSDGDTLKLQLQGSNGKSLSILYGKLGGLLEMHNEVVPQLQKDLDTLAQTLITEVNRIHASGYTLPEGDPPTTRTGINFFSGNDAATISLSPDILENVNNIAASTDGSAGNGEVALSIANLRSEKVLSGRTQTLDDYYTTMVHSLGVEIERAQHTRESQELLKDQLMNQREAESGVSLDEEMTHLIQYQRSFEAAAKVVKVVDEMMATVINMI